MRAWQRPVIPVLPGRSEAPLVFDTASNGLVAAETHDIARLYVCGITPYDATHLGHASTYLAFDTLHRVWLDAGYHVHYAQNITDVDDPLLERAAVTGVDWRALADEQIELFRTDMLSLRVIPPDNYVAVTEAVEPIARAVSKLWEAGLAYAVESPDAVSDSDIYFDTELASERSPWTLGDESNLDRATMLALFAERGGDPERPGKRHPLDPLLWRAERAGEPAWTSAFGAGRPGWHIECSVIALQHLGRDFTVQGGGSDLVFPHHEMSAGHAAALSGQPLAQLYSHAGMVSYRGEKMSKSLGNLVLVSRLREAGVDPRAIRIAVLGEHYRSDWEWTDAALAGAQRRLGTWSAAFAAHDRGTGEEGSARELLAAVRAVLHNDLDTPAALVFVDRAAEAGVDDNRLVVELLDALVGVDVRAGSARPGAQPE
ncbi:cysteine--1-D-myo-inosityl 2-amino-2-deoxy-alpha-D-glucopyranoside ligase [Compostimonas suwonensis]|uniref:L-cysteine:1D-myo-inositol 2-amino-2-deoxy-alpha-D-glucopyranoside ligase n=1 Tax=Compostimonas suwonensis TaxID=1048394 RepID=A0A2M9BYT0_9MICO|nr:cysteine--1-D-myo-inosityl 2-amino-2-deoxy-alpha-D-glucopyranoside ligase [Compostimonas suwonensis]PJJ63243.1 L-cysteine:1D-myo-inositol 2-amino-2-deoxy-alpha-D-glucopyranoside ligase [Compostimonas suwonensis]